MKSSYTRLTVGLITVSLVIAVVAMTILSSHSVRAATLVQSGLPLLVSDTSTSALYIPADQYPVNSAIANWPLRSDRCSTTAINSNIYKALPVLPSAVEGTIMPDNYAGDPFESDTNNPPGTYMYNRGGSHKIAAGNCALPVGSAAPQPLYIPWLTAIRDGGTSKKPSWVNLLSSQGGVSINPTAYGGWATTTDPLTYPGLAPAIQLSPRNVASAVVYNPSCTNYSSGMNGNQNGSGWFSGYTQFDEADLIWGKLCQDGRNHMHTMLANNGYTSTQINNVTQYGRYNGIYSMGTTLFRRVFTLTQADIDRVVAAEAQGGGLYLDMLADDWYSVYMNGSFILDNDLTSQPLYSFRLNLSSLKPAGQPNILAIEVMDKMTTDPTYSNIGVGLAYALVVKKTAGYVITPTTTCNTSIASPGSTVTCTHTAAMGNSMISSSNPTTITVRCEAVRANGSQTSSLVLVDQNCVLPANTYVPGDPFGVYYSRGIKTNIIVQYGTPYSATYTFTVPPFSASFPDGSKLCTFLRVNPSKMDEFGMTSGPTDSPQYCITVTSAAVPKPPLVYFRRGDVWADGDITGSTYTSGTVFASHGEYGVFSRTGTISTFTSQNSFVLPGSGLTFANTPSLGQFNTTGTMITPTFVIAGAAASSPTTITLDTMANGDYNFNVPILTVTATAPLDKNIRVHNSGEIVISSNISLAATAKTSLADLPYVLLVADGAMTVNDAVTTVSATLVSGGTLKTCTTKPANSSSCPAPLSISGAVIAARLGLYRTYSGAGVTQFTGAAETISTSSSSVLVPWTRAITGNLVTDFESELPPRY